MQCKSKSIKSWAIHQILSLYLTENDNKAPNFNYNGNFYLIKWQNKDVKGEIEKKKLR